MTRPKSSVAERRVAAASSALIGDTARSRHYLTDRSPRVRAGALTSLGRLGQLCQDDIARAVTDPSPIVRRAICEIASRLPRACFTELLDDKAASVVEAAAFAVGETGERAAVPRLVEIATTHSDPLCRESSIAALGAIGDPVGLVAVIGGLSDVPAIRRRAVVSLSAFEGNEVDTVLRGALSDRDWQVRQAAADVLGVSDQESR